MQELSNIMMILHLQNFIFSFLIASIIIIFLFKKQKCFYKSSTIFFMSV